MRPTPTLRRLIAALAALATAAALAACGGASGKTTTSPAAASAGGSASRTTRAACLRQHGITIPTGSRAASGAGVSGGGGPPSGAPSGGLPGAGAGGGKFQAAIKACGGNLPGRPPGAGLPRQAISKYVSCVRGHGYQLPQPNFSGNGSVFPASVRSSKKFQAASKSCQSLLTPARTTPPGA